MSSENHLEINKSLDEHPLAEILIEISESRLEGSLRVSHHQCKAVLYFKNGELVFAVSNQRQHRIFEMLLKAGMLTKQQLVEIPDFANDLALTKALRENAMFSELALQAVFKRQIEGILHEAVVWKDGSWTFSPLARVKDDINYKINIFNLLIEFARKMPKEAIVRRFKSFKETFGRKPQVPSSINLLPHEAFVLSRFEQSFLKIEEMKAMSGMSDSDNLQCLYALWLGGFLFRKGWKKAFNEYLIADILSAKLELKKQTAPPPVGKISIESPKTFEAPVEEVIVKPEKPPEPVKEELTLEKYLDQIEKAETHYQILDIPMKASGNEVKQAYFSLAKRFHPDLFYKKTDAENQRRIQNAFTEIAHAYETLRNEESRTRYDFKLRKVLQELEKLEKTEKANKSESPQTSHKQLSEASEIFDHGFNLLMEEEYEAALPYISRAVLLAPDVARYHAYFGKVLSADKTQKFKAEAEFQAAIKIEPENPTFRIMLAEFFVKYNLLKRAEGELNRLLSIDPNNSEAKAMLNRLK